MGFGTQKSCSVAKLPFSFCCRCFPYPCLFLHFRTSILSRLMSPAFSHPWFSPLSPRFLSCLVISHTHLGALQFFAESRTHCPSRHCCHDLAGLLAPFPTFNCILRLLMSCWFTYTTKIISSPFYFPYVPSTSPILLHSVITPSVLCALHLQFFLCSTQFFHTTYCSEDECCIHVHSIIPEDRHFQYLKVFVFTFKVKLSHFRPSVAQRVGIGIALLFHDCGTRRGEWSAACPGRTYPQERPGTHCTGGWVGPRAGLDWQKNLVPTGFRSRTVQPVVSRYTNWATGPTFVFTYTCPYYYINSHFSVLC